MAESAFSSSESLAQVASYLIWRRLVICGEMDAGDGDSSAPALYLSKAAIGIL